MVLTVRVWVPQGDLRSTRDLKGGAEDLHSLGGLREKRVVDWRWERVCRSGRGRTTTRREFHGAWSRGVESPEIEQDRTKVYTTGLATCGLSKCRLGGVCVCGRGGAREEEAAGEERGE